MTYEQQTSEIEAREAWQSVRNAAFRKLGRGVEVEKVHDGNRFVGIEGADGIGFVLLTSAGYGANDAAGIGVFATLDEARIAAREFVETGKSK